MRIETNVDLMPEKSRHQVQVSLIGRQIGRQYLDNTSNAAAQLPMYRFADLRINYDLKQHEKHPLSLVFSINNFTDNRFSSNGWVYRFVSQGYDPTPDDPYVRSESNGRYNQTGLFPQAGRNYMLSVIARL